MKPLLLVDAGNSLIKWATVVPDGKIEVQGELTTCEASQGQIKELGETFAGSQLILASVVPQITTWFEQAFGRDFFSLSGGASNLPLAFDYPEPAQIGADRLAVAIAAAEEKIYPSIVVSCGTATAFTVLDAQGAFCGGAIAPGPLTQISSLADATAQLELIPLAGPRGLPAKSTNEAIRAGVILSFKGGAKETVEQLTGALGALPRILLTGGYAEFLQPVLPDAELRPLLVFEGLRIMGQRQQSARSS